ncbi:MAG: regulator [Planctomycetes bacterium]|nr:regulator [Planctomycetota bacterium]
MDPRTIRRAAPAALLAAALLLPACGREEALAVGDGGAGGAAAGEAPAERPAPVARAATALERPPAAGAIYDRWETIGVAEGLPARKVLSVTCEPDRVWACTEGGLAEIAGGKVVRVWTPADGLAHRVVTSCARSATTGDLWIGTFGGLSRLSGGRITTWRQTTSGLMNDVVYGVDCEGDRVWCATASGLSWYDFARDRWGVYDHNNAVFHEPWVYAVTVGDGLVWLGVWGSGVISLEPSTETWREFRDPDGEMEVELVPDDGPVHVITSSLSYDEGAVWQSTYFGVSRYRDGRWRSWLKKDSGLPSDFVNSVKARGRWALFNTDSGLCVTDGDHWAVYTRRADGKGEVRLTRPGREPEVRVLDTAPPHDFVFQSDARGREVWIATAEGVGHGTATGGATMVPAEAGGSERR